MAKRTSRPLLAALAGLLALAGMSLWLAMLLGPAMFATGLARTAGHLNRAERRLAEGTQEDARYETLAAGEAARLAQRGFALAAPSFDLARSVPRLRHVVEQLPHLAGAARHSGRAAVGSLALTHDVLSGPASLLARDERGNARVRLDGIKRLDGAVGLVATEAKAAKRELQAIEARELPRALRRAVKRGISRVGEAESVLEKARAGLAILPGILGNEGPRLYLLGMQNSAELRGTGGAILQFAFLSVEDGRARLMTPRTVYKVDIERRVISIDLPRDAWYQQGIADARRFGNANWSPDWPLSAKLTLAYARAARKKLDVSFPAQIDGLIAVDPLTMEKLVPATGPQRIGAGHRLTRKTIVNFVLHKAYATYPIPATRRSVLRQVVERFYEELLTPRHPAKLVTGLGESLSEKHVQIWLARRQEQSFVERMNWDGSIEKARGKDYFYVVQQNVGGNKLDYFARTDLRTHITLETDGSARTRTTATISNNVFLPQPRYMLGDTGPLGALHRPMVNLYVHDEAQLTDTTVEGKRLDSPPPAAWVSGRPPEHLELGKKVWPATLEIPPGETGAVTYDYTSPGVIQEEDGRKVYRLVVQHQPKVVPEELTLRVRLPQGASEVQTKGFRRDDGAVVWSGALREDMVLEVSWRA